MSQNRQKSPSLNELNIITFLLGEESLVNPTAERFKFFSLYFVEVIRYFNNNFKHFVYEQRRGTGQNINNHLKN